MAGAWLRTWLKIVVVAGVLAASVVEAVHAQNHEASPAERQFAALEQRYAPPSSEVQQAAYAGLPTPTPAAAPTIIPPANAGSNYLSSQGSTEVIVPPSSDNWCLPQQEPCRTSSWTAAIELIPTVTRVTDGPLGRWEDDSSLAIRLILGYEDPEGIGVRARVWALAQDAETSVDDVELNMGSFDVDLYKRVLIDRGELAFGGGPSSGALEFKLSDNSYSKYEGAGATMFLDGYYGLVEFDKSELGAIARARYSILLGDWHDTTGFVIPPTDNDTMSIAELAWGLEFRRRFGQCDDHSWFIGVLAEYQRWQSDWMGRFAGSSVGASGVNIYTGLNW
jgi:hypothetical protein